MFKHLRWAGRCSGVGALFAGALALIQGCTQSNEDLQAILILILLLLGGCSAQITIDGTGSGTVVGQDNAINCTITLGDANGVCEIEAESGSTQTFVATPASRFAFDGWINCSNPSGNLCEHTVIDSVTIVANFSPAVTLNVELAFPDNGVITSDIGGINCTGDGLGVFANGVCSATFAAGTVVTLTATEDAFIGVEWNIGCVAPAFVFDQVIQVLMDTDRTCRATFPN